MADDTNDQGALYTFTPLLGAGIGDANNYQIIENTEPPPPVTSAEVQRQTDNAINTSIQPVLPPSPVTGSEVLNNAIPGPTAPPPVTSDQILGNSFPTSTPPPPVTSADFNTNVNNTNSGPSIDPSINGDSNIAGANYGPSSATNTLGQQPGTGTQAVTSLAPGSNNPINDILGGFGGGSTPFSQDYWNRMFQGMADVPLNQSVTVAAQGPNVNQGDAAGRRVRLRPKPGGASQVYGSSKILSPLKNTNGLVWPYQPLITYAQDVDYKSMELTHSNQDIYAYHRTPSLKLSVEGEFSVQNQTEGLYAMAAIHFLRVVTKMNFGDSDPKKGTPPPVLLFDAYGPYMFNQLPVIVNSFSISLPKDVDYVPVDLTGNKLPSTTTGKWANLTTEYFANQSSDSTVWLPAVFNITVGLIVQNSPTRLRSFNLDKFRNGSLVKQGGWA